MSALFIDILIFAAIAAFLFFRLRDVLGTKHGEERKRKTIFDQESKKADSLGDKQSKKESPLFSSHDQQSFDRSTESVLTKIALADRYFTPEHFISGAKQAFEMIVEGFARGDKELLEDLLSPELMDAFEKVIDERAKDNHKAVTDILNIKKAEIMQAEIVSLKGVDYSHLTVRFVADETRYIKDEEGQIIMGDPDGVNETIDIWTFSRELQAPDPNWILIATRTEHDEPKEEPKEKTGKAETKKSKKKEG